MRLLFVTSTLPHPPRTGSALIALNQIRHLAARHTVDLISFRNIKNPNDLGDLRCWCNHIELIDPPPRWRVSANLLYGVAFDPHPEISRPKSVKMSRAVNLRLKETAYDVVLFQLTGTAQFRPQWYKGATIWCLEDPPVLKKRRMQPMRPWYIQPLVWFITDRLLRYEKEQASRFDRIILVNEKDSHEYGRTLNGARLDWVPSGIDVDAFHPEKEIIRREGMIVITGNMFHKPNVDGVEYFCREIFPLVCAQVPLATLWLVGDGPVKKIRKLTSDPRITVTGFVPDIRPYLQRAIVSACPIRLRIGTQTKVLEALACATPVVTTSAGNHGVGAESGEHLYVADESTEFASRVVSLLRRERWSALSLNGRRFVEDNFTWEKSVMKLEQILEQLVAKV